MRGPDPRIHPFPEDGLPGHTASRGPAMTPDLQQHRTHRHNDVKAEGAARLYIEGNEMEAAMRVFVLSVAAAAIIAGISYVSLSSFQESTATATTTGSARLDWQEQSDVYGREVPAPRGTPQQ
jgi:hypothetical protein